MPARDAQIILGHSRMAVTLEIYTHTDDEAKADALNRLHGLLDGGSSVPTATELGYNRIRGLLRDRRSSRWAQLGSNQ